MPSLGLDFVKASLIYEIPHLVSHTCLIQLVESYRSILEQAESITGVSYLPPSVNGNSNNGASVGGRPTSASSSSTVHRGQGHDLTQEVVDGMMQNATYGMQMLDVAFRTKSQLASGPPTSQYYPQHPSQSHHQPPLNSLTAPSAQVQPPPPTTPVTAASSSSSSYGYNNTNSHPHPHPHQNADSTSSSPRMMKDGGGVSVKSNDDGGRKVKSESGIEKGVPANGTNATTTATATAATAAGATGAGTGTTVSATGGDRLKRQVRHSRVFVCKNIYLILNIETR